MRREWIAGIFLMVLAVAYYKMADDIPRSLMSDEVGAGGFPKNLAIALFVLAAIYTMQGILKYRRRAAGDHDSEQARADKEKHAAARAAIMFAIGVGYLVIVSWAGYLLSVMAIILVTALFLRQPFSRSVVLTSVLGAVFFFLLFDILLRIPMPRGIWARLF